MGLINAWKGFFTPGNQDVKAIAPRRRMYAGANSGRLTSNWFAAATSADSEIKSSNKRLRQRTRQTCRDNVYARQAQRSIVQNVIGTGVRIQCDVRKLRGGKLDTKINDTIEAAWKEWIRYDSCSASGRDSLDDMSRLIVKSLFESGEVFVRLIKRPFGRSKVPFALELLESDQLDDDYEGTPSKTTSWRMGIERDAFQRAKRYAFFKKHPGDTPFPTPVGEKRHMILPASEVIHLFIADRPGQTRGVSWLASALQDLHHLSGFQEASVIRARAASSLMGFISSPEGELDPGGEVMDEERVSEFQPGVWKYLAPGETAHVPQLDAPSGEFEPFLRAMLRGLASGCGVSYESVSRDFSQTNYSSSRLSLIEDRDHYRTIQGFLQERFFQPVFDQWLELAVLGNTLDLPTFETEPDRFKRVRWLFRGWNYVDPQKEIQAAKEAVKAGFKTQAQVVAESGGDLEELMASRKREVDQAAQLNLAFDTNPASTPTKEEVSTVDEKVESESNGGKKARPGSADSDS